jgi:ribosome-binding protein aMBF1 (putative translation factor)
VLGAADERTGTDSCRNPYRSGENVPCGPWSENIPFWDTHVSPSKLLRVAWRDEKKSGAQAQLGSLLRAARERSGIRQAELARLLGVPQSFVSKYESDERRLDIFEVKLICAHVGLSLPDLDALLDNRTGK